MIVLYFKRPERNQGREIETYIVFRHFLFLWERVRAANNSPHVFCCYDRSSQEGEKLFTIMPYATLPGMKQSDKENALLSSNIQIPVLPSSPRWFSSDFHRRAYPLPSSLCRSASLFGVVCSAFFGAIIPLFRWQYLTPRISHGTAAVIAFRGSRRP